MSLYFVQKLQPTWEAVRNVAKKAIMCEESNTGKHSSPNIITGAGNFPRYFVLKPSLELAASMGSSELQRVLASSAPCLLAAAGVRKEVLKMPIFNLLSISLPSSSCSASPEPWRILTYSCTLLSFISALSFYPDALSKLSQPEIKLYVGFFTLLAVPKLKHMATSCVDAVFCGAVSLRFI